MDLRRIRTFVAVAELGTVSKASVYLRVAQPALSRQIGSFEEELSLKLFDRIGSRLVLTGEGEQMLVECRALLNHAQAVGERAQLLGRGDMGVLKVAASPQFIEGILADYLHGYAERYPRVQVKLVEAISWADTQGMLERGEIHLGQNLLRAVQPGDMRFANHPMEAVDLLAAYHDPLPLDRAGAIEVARIARYPLLLLDTSFVSRRTFDAVCRVASIKANVVFESRTPHTLLAMAERGHGVALVPSAVQINRYTLHATRVTHSGESLREPLAIFWDARRPLPRYAAAFCEELAVHVRQVFPITRPSESALKEKHKGAAAKACDSEPRR